MQRVFLAALASVAVACAPSVEKGASVHDIIGELRGTLPDFLAADINTIHRIPPDEWVELTTTDERNLARTFIGPYPISRRAYPSQNVHPLRVWAHIGRLDVLRFQYEALSLHLELFVTSWMSVLWVDPAPPPGADQEERIQQMCARVLRYPTHRPNPRWYFFPGRPGESTRFSTDPEGLNHFPRFRAGEYDGGIVGQSLYVASFVGTDGRSSRDIAAGDMWLDGAIEEAWKTRGPRRPAP